MRAAVFTLCDMFIIGCAFAQVPPFDKKIVVPQETTPATPSINEKINQKANNIFYKLNKSTQEQVDKEKIEGIKIEQKDQIETEAAEEMQEIREDRKYSLKLASVFAAIVAASEEDIFKKPLLPGPSQFDSRIEPRQLDPLIDWEQKILDNGKSVGLIVKRDNLYQLSDSIWKLGTGLTLGDKYKLCPGQAFATQPVAGEGTAFIITEKKFMTAAHVLTEPSTNYAVVFGFEMINRTGAYEAYIPASNIYDVSRITLKDDNSDIAVFETDRQINRKPLVISKASVVKGNEVYMIGYPSGLPQKIAMNASVSDETNFLFFYTTLDAFQGNSGSPVFDFKSHEIIGILVSGGTDYKWNGNCNTVSVCRIPYCTGEKAIRIHGTLLNITD